MIRVTYKTDTYLSIGEITGLQGDAKVISRKNLDRLKRSIKKHGFFVPLFVWQKTPGSKVYILDGHQRVKAVREICEETACEAPALPVEFVTAKSKRDAAEKLLAITSQFGDFDFDGLRAFGAEFKLELPKLDTIRLLNTEIIWPTDPEETIADDDVPSGVKPITKPGDLWLLGRHRLLCGDSTEQKDVDRLLAGDTPILMVTDPPYGVDYDASWRNEVDDFDRHRMGKVVNDDRSDWLDAWKLSPAAVVYSWAPTGRDILEHLLAFERSDFKVRYILVWVKQNQVMSRGAYHWKHESCIYAVRNGSTANWIGGRKQTSVWEIANLNPMGGNATEAKTDHSTQKPIECMARPIRNHTGDVYDPFAGSGTTYIAAEKESRICYGMEIDPHYCDVIVQRYRDWCEANNIACEIKREKQAKSS